MTTLETILIIYILLNWFLLIMFTILPKRVVNKVSFLFFIPCPPLVIVFIGEGIRKITTKEKEEEKENEIIKMSKILDINPSVFFN